MSSAAQSAPKIVVAAQRSLVDKVVEAIIAEIESGQLAPNARLIQEDLARAYGVSRQPVQQALLLLKNQGLVRDSPSRGFAVSPLDPDYVQNLYEIRAALDALASRLAAKARSASALEEGRSLIAAGRAAIERRSLAEQIAADTNFHNFVSRLSGNPLIAEATAPHWPYVRQVMAEVLRADEALPNRIWDEHEAILRAIAAGDDQQAETLSRRHILDASSILVGRLRARRNEWNEEQNKMSRRIER